MAVEVKDDEGDYKGNPFDIIHSEDDRIKQSLFYNMLFNEVLSKKLYSKIF